MISPTTKDILRIIRTYAYLNGMSMSEFARKAGVSKSWISKMKHTDTEISLKFAEKLLDAAGYKIVVKHHTQLTEEDLADIKTISDEELDRKDRENLEVKKLIDENKKLVEQSTKSISRLRKLALQQQE